MNAQFDGSSQADPRGAQHQTVQPQPTVPRPPGLTPGCATRAPRHTLLPVRLLHSLVSATLRVHTARRCPCSEWRGAHACACVVWAADRAQVPGGLVSALSSPEPPTRGSSPQTLTVRLSVQPGAQRRDGARWPCSRDTSPPCRHHAARALTLPASPAGGTAGASSDPRVACDRSRVLLHADERPGSTVPGKVGSACPAPHCCPHAPPRAPSHAARVPLKAKKSVAVAETPSVVSHHPESDAAEAVASRKTDAILRAAKKDLLTLMKLDVSAQPAGPAGADGAAAPRVGGGRPAPADGAPDGAPCCPRSPWSQPPPEAGLLRAPGGILTAHGAAGGRGRCVPRSHSVGRATTQDANGGPSDGADRVPPARPPPTLFRHAQRARGLRAMGSHCARDEAPSPAGSIHATDRFRETAALGLVWTLWVACPACPEPTATLSLRCWRPRRPCSGPVRECTVCARPSPVLRGTRLRARGSVSPSRGAAGGSCGPGAPGLRHRDVRVGCEPGGAEAGLLQAGRSALHRGGGGASASRPAPASPRPACVLGREPAATHSSCAGILPRVCRVRLPQGSRGQEFLLMAQRAPRSCSAWRVRPAPCLRDVSFDLGRIFSAMLSKCYCFCF